MTTIERMKQLRKQGHRFSPWLRKCAETTNHWEQLEYLDLVRLDWQPDYGLSYEDLAGDCFDESNYDSVPGGERTVKAQEKAFRESIEQDGVWGLVGQYRLTPDSDWIDGDSVWGFVGTDDTGYETDIMAETINQLKEALRDRPRIVITAGK